MYPVKTIHPQKFSRCLVYEVIDENVKTFYHILINEDTLQQQ